MSPPAGVTQHPARGGALVPLRPLEEPAPPPDLRHSDVDEWGRSESARELFRRIYTPLYRYWFRVEWEGIEKIPAKGGALLVANHAGAIPADAPIIMHGIEEEIGRPVYGMADHLFRSLPVVGTLWARGGGVAAHPDNAYRLLHDQGHLALVFPEGTKGTGKAFTERYKLRRFGRGGFVEIAMRAGVPVIPITVVGSEEVMPIVVKAQRLAKILGVPYVPITANMLLLGPLGLLGYFPAKIKVRVLDPVTFDVEPDQERYPRSHVFEEAEAIRRRMQMSIYDMLRKRRSVWFG
ncbi:MAG TPA: lysophospholipid acyltransferase family protein [Acidimicrobiales bacterium]|nr:lysophospholipid acyltransferase family protein [Acidimicrobiales bacterium]